MTRQYTSWGRWPRHAHQIFSLPDRYARLPDFNSMLPYGNGRSYGDVCQNEGRYLLSTRGMDRFIGFDPILGVLDCEAGVLLSEIIDLVLPKGWFPSVTPGTRFVTVGGAIANDVHGKNHHRAGSFGNHVLDFDLLRSDGSVLHCSQESNREWFAATIGGLGLTGLILRARIQLRPVPGPWIHGDSLRFGSLSEFFALSSASDASHEYTVAWIDCAAGGSRLGRGVFLRGNHASAIGTEPGPEPSGRSLRVPLTPPVSLIGRISLRAFNYCYFHRPAARVNGAVWHYRPFFYPLDGVLDWNRIYGPKGFFQYQCAIPQKDAEQALIEMLRRISRSGLGSFLSVLKLFGSAPSRGMLSFPRPGATLALDFPNRGACTLTLLESLDAITRDVGGAVYPAKDARMSSTSFKQYYPAWKDFSGYVDPRFSSSFWRRVTGNVR